MGFQKTMLVVDGMPERLESLQHLLKRSGCRILSEGDGRAVLPRALAELPDLIVGALDMAPFDGVELSRMIRRDPRLSTTPVLLIASSHFETERAIEALNAGADDCLLPPYLPELLVAKASGMIARKGALDGLLRGREAYLAETQDLLKIGSFEFDIAPDRWAWSEELGRIMGLELETAEANEALLVRYLRAGDVDFVQEVIRESTVDRQPVVRELSLQEEGGTNRVLELRGRLAGDLMSASGRVIGTVQDITEQKRREVAMHKSRDQVVQSQKMEALGQLAAGVAHDFNNLLTVIMGYTDFLTTHLDRTSQMLPFLEEIGKASERASVLTRQLLVFSRQQILQRQVLNLNSIVENLAGMLARIIGEGIELQTKLASDLGNVEIDRGQAEQVILNLAINSRDAMPEGGSLLIETSNVALEEPYVDTHLGVRPGDYVMLTVSDTGCGMDERTKARIFEPFFTTKPPGKGTGLGLATVYGIVRQGGGSIWVYSEPDKGTTFKIYLPRTGRLVEESREGLEQDLSAGGNETVLLVEDEEVLRVLIKRVLESIGYTVLAAGDGLEAIRISEQYPGRVHLLLTDVVMPEMDGFALSERLLAKWPGMCVLYMSGHSTDTTSHYSAVEQGSHFLQKPFSPGILARKVRQALDSGAQKGGCVTGGE